MIGTDKPSRTLADITRNSSIKGANSEITEINQLIIDACNEGETAILRKILKGGTQAWLKQNGFEITEYSYGGFTPHNYKISW